METQSPIEYVKSANGEVLDLESSSNLRQVQRYSSSSSGFTPSASGERESHSKPASGKANQIQDSNPNVETFTAYSMADLENQLHQIAQDCDAASPEELIAEPERSYSASASSSSSSAGQIHVASGSATASSRGTGSSSSRCTGSSSSNSINESGAGVCIEIESGIGGPTKAKKSVRLSFSEYNKFAKKKTAAIASGKSKDNVLGEDVIADFGSSFGSDMESLSEQRALVQEQDDQKIFGSVKEKDNFNQNNDNKPQIQNYQKPLKLSVLGFLPSDVNATNTGDVVNANSDGVGVVSADEIETESNSVLLDDDFDIQAVETQPLLVRQESPGDWGCGYQHQDQSPRIAYGMPMPSAKANQNRALQGMNNHNAKTKKISKQTKSIMIVAFVIVGALIVAGAAMAFSTLCSPNGGMLGCCHDQAVAEDEEQKQDGVQAGNENANAIGDSSSATVDEDISDLEGDVEQQDPNEENLEDQNEPSTTDSNLELSSQNPDDPLGLVDEVNNGPETLTYPNQGLQQTKPHPLSISEVLAQGQDQEQGQKLDDAVDIVEEVLVGQESDNTMGNPLAISQDSLKHDKHDEEKDKDVKHLEKSEEEFQGKKNKKEDPQKQVNKNVNISPAQPATVTQSYFQPTFVLPTAQGTNNSVIAKVCEQVNGNDWLINGEVIDGQNASEAEVEDEDEDEMSENSNDNDKATNQEPTDTQNDIQADDEDGTSDYEESSNKVSNNETQFDQESDQESDERQTNQIFKKYDQEEITEEKKMQIEQWMGIVGKPLPWYSQLQNIIFDLREATTFLLNHEEEKQNLLKLTKEFIGEDSEWEWEQLFNHRIWSLTISQLDSKTDTQDQHDKFIEQFEKSLNEQVIDLDPQKAEIDVKHFQSLNRTALIKKEELLRFKLKDFRDKVIDSSPLLRKIKILQTIKRDLEKLRKLKSLGGKKFFGDQKELGKQILLNLDYTFAKKHHIYTQLIVWEKQKQKKYKKLYEQTKQTLEELLWGSDTEKQNKWKYLDQEYKKYYGKEQKWKNKEKLLSIKMVQWMHSTDLTEVNADSLSSWLKHEICQSIAQLQCVTVKDNQQQLMTASSDELGFYIKSAISMVKVIFESFQELNKLFLDLTSWTNGTRKLKFLQQFVDWALLATMMENDLLELKNLKDRVSEHQSNKFDQSKLQPTENTSKNEGKKFAKTQPFYLLTQAIKSLGQQLKTHGNEFNIVYPPAKVQLDVQQVQVKDQQFKDYPKEEEKIRKLVQRDHILGQLCASHAGRESGFWKLYQLRHGDSVLKLNSAELPKNWLERLMKQDIKINLSKQHDIENESLERASNVFVQRGNAIISYLLHGELQNVGSNLDGDGTDTEGQFFVYAGDKYKILADLDTQPKAPSEQGDNKLIFDYDFIYLFKNK